MSNTRKRQIFLAFFTLVLLSFGACSRGGQPADQGVPETQPSQLQQENDVLLGSASPFEDLTEFAVAGDESGMDQALADIEGALPVVRSTLAPGPRQRFDSLLESLRAARETGNYLDVALTSVEGYRILVESLHDEALTVPKAVSLLDYAGFRLSVLAGLESPDWTAIQAITEEARGFWSGLEGRVENPGLRDAMNTTIRGLEQAVAARDAKMAAFAASIDLDLVDLLESYFEETGPLVHGSR
jgi:hypothetical protein